MGKHKLYWNDTISNIYSVTCADLRLLKKKFSIIAISETFTDQSTEGLINIPGYTLHVKSRVGRIGGGVALYVDTDLDLIVKIRPDLDT